MDLLANLEFIDIIRLFFCLLGAIAVICYVIQRNRSTPQEPSPAQKPPVKKTIPEGITAMQMNSELELLKERHALWPEIIVSLNPTSDKPTNDLLTTLQENYQFVPHVALNIILHESKKALMKNPNIPFNAVLQMSVHNMGKGTVKTTGSEGV